MSATCRGAVRRTDDNYVTPEWCVEEFLRAWFTKDPVAILPYGDRVLDPCAGGKQSRGHYTPHLLPYAEAISRACGAVVTTADIRKDSAARHTGLDFLATLPPIICGSGDGRGGGKGHFTHVISNPPFSLAVPFIERALDIVHPRGRVAFLLRLNFLGSQKRGPWWQTHMPRFVFVHSRRPSFANGKTDSCEYAHFVWQKDWTGGTELVVIPPSQSQGDAQ